MATVPTKLHQGALPSAPANSGQDRTRMRRDRIAAGLVLAALIGLLALMMWLDNQSSSIQPLDYDYWMMP